MSDIDSQHTPGESRNTTVWLLSTVAAYGLSLGILWAASMVQRVQDDYSCAVPSGMVHLVLVAVVIALIAGTSSLIGMILATGSRVWFVPLLFVMLPFVLFAGTQVWEASSGPRCEIASLGGPVAPPLESHAVTT